MASTQGNSGSAGKTVLTSNGVLPFDIATCSTCQAERLQRHGAGGLLGQPRGPSPPLHRSERQGRPGRTTRASQAPRVATAWRVPVAMGRLEAQVSPAARRLPVASSATSAATGRTFRAAICPPPPMAVPVARVGTAVRAEMPRARPVWMLPALPLPRHSDQQPGFAGRYYRRRWRQRDRRRGGAGCRVAPGVPEAPPLAGKPPAVSPATTTISPAAPSRPSPVGARVQPAAPAARLATAAAARAATLTAMSSPRRPRNRQPRHDFIGRCYRRGRRSRHGRGGWRGWCGW